MKRILFAMTLVGLLLPLAPRAEAQGDVSLSFFYDNLTPQGSWIDVGEYGYCFQPTVAVGQSDWRPYTDGYWAYTDYGWTWVSYEDFGWATYHYGRWTKLDTYGWVWLPGYDWGPAWVSWRTGGDYVGWAPLPPEDGVVYEGRPVTSQVDFTFGIGPLYYNFVDIRYIGEPVLRSRILTPSRNVTIINRTVNVTNITYNNSFVYNYGPDYNQLNQYSTRPIQRLSIQRETTVNANLAQTGSRGNFNRVSGNQLTVVAPTIQRSQRQIAPKQVKARVRQPKIERGWQGVSNRQQLETEMKKENAQNVPKPTFQPQPNRERVKVAGARESGQHHGGGPRAEQADKQNAPSAESSADQNGVNNRRAEREARRAQAPDDQEQAQKRPNDDQQDGQQAERQDKAEQRAERQQERKERRAEAAENKERAEKAQDSVQRAEPAEADRPERRPRPDAGNRREERAERAEPAVRPQDDERANASKRDARENAQRRERPERAEGPERPDRPERAQERRDRQPEDQAQPQRPQRQSEARRQPPREQEQQGPDDQSPDPRKKKKQAQDDEPPPP